MHLSSPFLCTQNVAHIRVHVSGWCSIQRQQYYILDVVYRQYCCTAQAENNSGLFTEKESQEIVDNSITCAHNIFCFLSGIWHSKGNLELLTACKAKFKPPDRLPLYGFTSCQASGIVWQPPTVAWLPGRHNMACCCLTDCLYVQQPVAIITLYLLP